MFGLLLRRVGLDLDWRVEAEGGGGLRMLTTQTEQEGAKTTGRRQEQGSNDGNHEEGD